MGMKEAFDVFFGKMTQNYIDVFGTLPQVPFQEELCKTGLILTETKDNEGYVQWKPIIQTEKRSFDELEKYFGFEINEQIKDFLSTYWFLPLNGKIENGQGVVLLKLNGITPCIDFESYVKYNFNRNGAHYLNDNNYFLIGTYCKISGDDSYLVQVNNETGEVTAVEVMDKQSIKLSDSISELLLNMKGVW